jgi:hypothetical protein
MTCSARVPTGLFNLDHVVVGRGIVVVVETKTRSEAEGGSGTRTR